VSERKIEIAENLHRAELTVLERSEQIAEWVRLHAIKETEPSPVQIRLLSLIEKYQQQFATKKLIIGRDGGLYFDDDPKKGNDINLARDVYGYIDPIRLTNFQDLMEEMPIEYLRFLPESRLGNPFVVNITEMGSRYLKAAHP
jgi:hypothetical protein